MMSLGMTTGFILLPMIVYKSIKLPTYRFLLFTEKSKKKRDEYFRKMNDRRTFWVVTVLMDLIIIIIVNYLFR